MKYKLINKTTSEEHICEKVVIDGWDYYVSYVYGKPTIATNNINHHIPKVVDETWKFFKEVDGTCEKDQYEHWLYKSGYNKSQETHPNSDGDMAEFAEWASKYDWVFMADRNYWVNDDSRLHPKSTKELIQIWKEQRTKILYYE